MREIQHVVTAADNVSLSIREYLPEVTPVMQTMVFIHGACEHGGRYAEFAKAATVLGWRVIIPDLRGHGRSEGLRVHIRKFDQYVVDLERVYHHFHLVAERTAVVGHSMGGLVTARWLQVFPSRFSAVCLLSPYFGLKIRVDRFTWIAGQCLLWIWPWFRFRSRVRSADLSPDQEYLQRRRQDTLISPSVTAGWFFAVQQALVEVHRDAAQMTLPLLILQGDQDHVTDPAATQRWFSHTASSDRQLEFISGGLHELLQGKGASLMFQKILDWLNSRI